jgi:argininosuccinate lyase
LRDAYREIGKQVENNSFQSGISVNHTHSGSIGNLQNEAIKKQMENVLERFEFNKVNEALENLLR